MALVTLGSPRVGQLSTPSQLCQLQSQIVTLKFAFGRKSDEYDSVERIYVDNADGPVEVLKYDYAKFITKEEDGCLIFKFINIDVEKVFMLTFKHSGGQRIIALAALIDRALSVQ
ncbi:hypothetical protein DdX_21879 [Ditylenchus destructor]|uniref:Uncharacterized protein n=1 Tax=Ditylenchus destructor TaxID=166010 RepID=A0AAD4QV59_9BILA|nr:hypothetical protein DdX_21879 [Ditylenchus destructor]